MAAIAGHHQFFLRGFLCQPFGQIEIFHHLGDDLLRRLAQRDLLGLVEAIALALADPLTLVCDHLHALGEVFAGD